MISIFGLRPIQLFGYTLWAGLMVIVLYMGYPYPALAGFTLCIMAGCLMVQRNRRSHMFLFKGQSGTMFFSSGEEDGILAIPTRVDWRKRSSENLVAMQFREKGYRRYHPPADLKGYYHEINNDAPLQPRITWATLPAIAATLGGLNASHGKQAAAYITAVLAADARSDRALIDVLEEIGYWLNKLNDDSETSLLSEADKAAVAELEIDVEQSKYRLRFPASSAADNDEQNIKKNEG